jgi:hypothetical protein
MGGAWPAGGNRKRWSRSRRPRSIDPPLTDEARQRLQQRRTLELALAQTQAELGAACRAAHRDMLQQRLVAIREAIEALS